MELENQSRTDEGSSVKLPSEYFLEYCGLDIDCALPEVETVRGKEAPNE